MPSAAIFKPKNGDVTFLLNISVFYSSLHGVIIIFIPFHKSSHRYCTYHEHVKMVIPREGTLFAAVHNGLDHTFTTYTCSMDIGKHFFRMLETADERKEVYVARQIFRPTCQKCV